MLKLFSNILSESHFSEALSLVNRKRGSFVRQPWLVGNFVRTSWLVAFFNRKRGSFVRKPWLVENFVRTSWLVAFFNRKRGSFVRKPWLVALANDNAMHQPMRSQLPGRGSLWLTNSGDIAAGASSTEKHIIYICTKMLFSIFSSYNWL